MKAHTYGNRLVGSQFSTRVRSQWSEKKRKYVRDYSNYVYRYVTDAPS